MGAICLFTVNSSHFNYRGIILKTHPLFQIQPLTVVLMYLMLTFPMVLNRLGEMLFLIVVF